MPIIGEFIDCQLLVTKYGSTQFNYNATLDYGDGFLQTITISDTNATKNEQNFVALFRHRFAQKGIYSLNFSINALNVNWTVEKDLRILGNK